MAVEETLAEFTVCFSMWCLGRLEELPGLSVVAGGGRRFLGLGEMFNLEENSTDDLVHMYICIHTVGTCTVRLQNT